MLAKAPSSEPRRFGNPTTALNVLRDVGIIIGQFDASEWNPAEKEPAPGTSGGAEALRKACQAASETHGTTDAVASMGIYANAWRE